MVYIIFYHFPVNINYFSKLFNCATLHFYITSMNLYNNSLVYIILIRTVRKTIKKHEINNPILFQKIIYNKKNDKWYSVPPLKVIFKTVTNIWRKKILIANLIRLQIFRLVFGIPSSVKRSKSLDNTLGPSPMFVCIIYFSKPGLFAGIVILYEKIIRCN